MARTGLASTTILGWAGPTHGVLSRTGFAFIRQAYYLAEVRRQGMQAGLLHGRAQQAGERLAAARAGRSPARADLLLTTHSTYTRTSSCRHSAAFAFTNHRPFKQNSHLFSAVTILCAAVDSIAALLAGDYHESEDDNGMQGGCATSQVSPLSPTPTCMAQSAIA
eukprot:196344-Rhodomonas_salina.1